MKTIREMSVEVSDEPSPVKASKQTGKHKARESMSKNENKSIDKFKKPKAYEEERNLRVSK